MYIGPFNYATSLMYMHMHFLSLHQSCILKVHIPPKLAWYAQKYCKVKVANRSCKYAHYPSKQYGTDPNVYALHMVKNRGSPFFNRSMAY